MIGIYKITNPFNQVYIGQSIDIPTRFKSHKKGVNSNFHLMMSIGKHGVENHTFEILEECDKDILTEKENHYLSIYKEDYLLFNYSIYMFGVENCFKLIDSCDFGINELKRRKAKKEAHVQFLLENRKSFNTDSNETLNEIKELYTKLKNKKSFCAELGTIEEVETGAMTIYNHWFGSFWAIPEKHQDLVLSKLKEKQL